MLPEHTKFIHCVDVAVSDMLNYTEAHIAEEAVKRRIVADLTHIMSKRVTFHDHLDPISFDKRFRGTVVMMTLAEYKQILDSRYIVNPQQTAVSTRGFGALNPTVAVEQTSKIIDTAVKSSKSPTDFLSNRVAQLQQPKRKS